MDEHLASEEQEGNCRNGYSSKTVHTDSSSIELAVPRGRQGKFEPQLVEKHCRRLPGFDRPLDSSYQIVFFDGARVKTRYEGRVVNMVIYVALAINNAGRKELLGLWLFPTESAKLWQQVFADLANRGGWWSASSMPSLTICPG